jgi:hypothetical protein
MIPVVHRSRVRQAGLLNVQKHRVEGRECAEPDGKFKELIDGLAAIVKAGSQR